MLNQNIIAIGLKIQGIVQGVGFRPFIYKLAKQYNIQGHIANTQEGVWIHAQGMKENIACFSRDIKIKAPPLARITRISSYPESVKDFSSFSIIKSSRGTAGSTLISPDVSICGGCLRELFDPEDRRYRYPFINCTNCGPRYTIIDDIPYDRPNTSMKSFPMCEDCRKEYNDPENRRFHAQPNACPVCGPCVTLFDRERNKIETSDPVRKISALLASGHIAAIKGLGGFHLSADAGNPEAVLRLRQRKAREEKPFAIMSYDIETIRRYAHVSPDEEMLLKSHQRPIVLLRKKESSAIAESVSLKNNYLGVMLPYTPLHYLILSAFPASALVMTSGNISGEPIAIYNNDAFERLSGIADYFLIHNRDIYLRSDDSIIRHIRGASRFIRRSRGYAPAPVFLKNRVPQILACGAGLKNTVCLTKGLNAFLSQHIGDMENIETFNFFRMSIEHLKRILDIHPEIIAHDLHPDYMSTRYAMEQENVEKTAVQHHHAHIVSCMAENQVDSPVIGLAFDGTGLGSDGTIWGGEILISELHDFTRAAHLVYAPMPGSTAAAKEPWRMAVSYLYSTFGENFLDINLPFLRKVDKDQVKILMKMMDKGINSPMTSSLGRLFDGIAAIIGLRNHVSFEGQAAVEMEMTAELPEKISEYGCYDYEWTEEFPRRILFHPIIKGIVQDIQERKSQGIISTKFHTTLIHMFSDLCRQIRKDFGINRAALSGGVFQNSILFMGLLNELEKSGFEVFTHKLVPANDGGICLGQAAAAGARFSSRFSNSCSKNKKVMK